MTEGYDRSNPSGDCPFNICPRGGDYGPQIAESIIISALFGAKCVERTGQATDVFAKCRVTPPIQPPIPGYGAVNRGAPFPPSRYPVSANTHSRPPPLA